MSWKRRMQREKRRAVTANARAYHERMSQYFLTLSPWRMLVARGAAWIVARVIRVLLRFITALARFAVVRGACSCAATHAGPCRSNRAKGAA